MSEKRGSNPRPRPWQGRALPTELFSHLHSNKNSILVPYCGCKFNTLIQLHKPFLQKIYRQNITF